VPIDPEKVLGAKLPDSSWEWDADRVILYHLGLGAGVPANDPGELSYTYEQQLKVLPSFGVLPVFGALSGMLALPGMDFNPMMLLHGEQDLVIHRSIPIAGKVDNQSKIASVFDKGKGAVIVVEAETTLESGEQLCTNRFSSFIRGEGGFGGDPGPPTSNVAPSGPPDFEVESITLPQQALLYRLSGDKNPLHADPAMAALGGFDRPILHGLCSFGILCKAAVDHVLGGDVTRVRRYQARFAGVAFPGETLITSMWREDGTILMATRSKERGTPVISNAVITINEYHATTMRRK
jgi:acyl dehydratase